MHASDSLAAWLFACGSWRCAAEDGTLIATVSFPSLGSAGSVRRLPKTVAGYCATQCHGKEVSGFQLRPFVMIRPSAANLDSVPFSYGEVI